MKVLEAILTKLLKLASSLSIFSVACIMSSILRIAAPKRLMRFAALSHILSTLSLLSNTASPIAIASAIAAEFPYLKAMGSPLRFAALIIGCLVERLDLAFSAASPGRYTPWLALTSPAAKILHIGLPPLVNCQSTVIMLCTQGNLKGSLLRSTPLSL